MTITTLKVTVETESGEDVATDVDGLSRNPSLIVYGDARGAEWV